jgi:hypothetical protein
MTPPGQPGLRRPNPWADATITKLSVVRSGAPIAFFAVHFPLLEATLVDCTLRRTKAGRLWCAPPKRRRGLPDGSAQYDDIIEWDGGAPASRFSEACLEAIQRHSPELLTPLIEGHGEPAPRVLPQQRRDRPPAEPASTPGWWECDR